MKTNIPVFCILTISFLITAGCDRTQPASTQSTAAATPSTSPDVPQPAPAPPDTNAPDACDSGPCQERAFILVRPSVGINPTPTPIKLSGPERAALTLALDKSKATDSNAHIHADVAEHKLVFTADQSSDAGAAAHVSGNEPEISLTNGGPAKKVVATGPALQLLQKRAAR